ncbi:protein kinase [Streptomyces californicus]|uniref:protein kinase domain-containing protein n=1 Tax=Streptomyces californicus TaxID=67351 RepID=UPI00381A2D83
MQHPLYDMWTGLIDDQYALRRMIGRGGMGEVWLADDLVLRRAVAVKLLHTQLTLDEVAQSRFQREVRAAASLNHPRVAAVYDAGRLPTVPPRPFLVMEYVSGHTAAERLRSAPPSTQEAVDWVAGTLEALSCAHAAGLVHRDVKPANVMITADGLVKVMDFGIAHISDGHDKGVTRTGSTVGTAAYMSPEQAQGRPVDARSDLYSTGCMLYELLRGRGDNAAQHSQEVPRSPADGPGSVGPSRRGRTRCRRHHRGSGRDTRHRSRHADLPFLLPKPYARTRALRRSSGKHHPSDHRAQPDESARVDGTHDANRRRPRKSGREDPRTSQSRPGRAGPEHRAHSALQ